MKNIICICCLLFCIITISQAQSFQSAESAEYDPVNDRWLVSNGSNIIERANDGTLSFFGSGNTGFGIEVIGNTLFGISGSSVKGFDLTTEMEVMSISIPGANFLNGLTNDGVSTLYATDFGDNAIHKIDVSDFSNPTTEKIVNNTMTTPNGIIYDGNNNRLLFTSWASNNAPISQVDLTDFSVSIVINTNVGNIDGIDDDNEGNYYISSWSPNRITKYDSTFANPEIITTPAISRPADIGYSKETETLAIPVGTNVVFVEFQIPSSTNDLHVNDLGFSVFPNPISEQSVVSFNLEISEKVNLTIVNINGQVIKTLLSGTQPAGKHHVVLTGLSLPVGIYNCRLKTGKRDLIYKLVVPK